MEFDYRLAFGGCEIEGTVENSILFRGVKVAKGAVIRNSIIMQDNIIGANAALDLDALLPR